MTTVELLAELRRRGILLWAEDERLRFRGPQGALTAELRAELAAHKGDILAFLRRAQTTAEPPPIEPRRSDEDAPLSFAQERLWFLHQWQPDSPAYNIAQAVRLRGRLDMGALEQSLAALVQRHEVLRTTFAQPDPERGAQAVQRIAPSALHAGDALLPAIDLRDWPEATRAAEAQRYATAEARRPFDLSAGPLFRAALLRLAEHEYLLLLTLHHSVSDGWSTGVLIRDLVALYTACVRHADPALAELPPLPVQYADYAIWQRAWLQGPTLEEQLAYWRRQLRPENTSTLPVLELPADRPRLPGRSLAQTAHGARAAVELTPELVAALRALSQRQGVTLFMTLLAAFQTLLHRYSGADELLVGTPVAGRNRPEIEELIGCFVNTLVLRADLSGSPSFRALLRQVRETTLDAFAHQDVPFEKLVETLQPERDLSRPPLFQVMFALQNAPLPAVKLPDLAVQPVPIDPGIARFELLLNLQEQPGGVDGWFEYSTDLFDATTIERLGQHFQTLLAGIVADPDQPIDDLPLLTPDERQRLLSWNATTDYPRELCVHQLFEQQAATTPAAIAVVRADRPAAQLSYDELNRRANQLAHTLIARGVGPEVRVGVSIERSLELIVALLAILKAGGVYVPLDPAYPAERLRFMQQDAALGLVLTDQSPRPPDHDPSPAHPPLPTIDVARDWPTIAQGSPDNPAQPVTADNLAYVIYTSGSTGQPKGVCIPHRGVVRLVRNTDYASLSSEQVMLQLAPVAFDASTFEIWGSLLNGARLVLFPPGPGDLSELGAVLARHQVTTLWLTAGLFQQVVEARVADLAPVRQLLAGGDVLSVPHVRMVRQQLPACRLINGYGPTESTTFACCATIADVTGPSVPIGRPIANTTVYLLDRHLQPVPVGVPGELYIGGDGLARGYLNRPALTAERFVPHPWSAAVGARLYRTGDLARYLPDGQIEFLGRIDQQVKLRGFRIELGEIEAALLRHPAIREAAVVAREDAGATSEKRLVAYVVTGSRQAEAEHRAEHGAQSTEEPASQKLVTDHRSPTTAALRAFLQQSLPTYMLPSAFVMLDALPLNANGKLDRRALPMPEATRPADSARVAPRTPTEALIAAVWAETLGLEEVGVDDHFFELGGHSLLAMQLIARLRARLGAEVSLQRLFETPTVAGLAAALDGHTDQPPSATLPQIEPDLAQRQQPFPLTDVQQAYWIGRSGDFELGNVAAHVYLEVETTVLELDRLDQAWQRLIERHDMLRAVVLPDGQQQILATVTHTPIAVLDLRDQPEPVVAAELAAIRQRMSHQILPSSRAPLCELRATRLDQRLTRLHISFDALIGDAWSWLILVRELEQIYQKPTAALPPLELSFRDYVLAETQLQTSDLYRRAQNYWQQRLLTLPPAPELPLATSPATITRPQFERRTTRLEPPDWHRLKARASQVGLTPSALIAAAFAEVLTVWSKSPRFTINLTLFNRLPLHPQVDQIVGDFTSVTLLAVDNSTPEPFAVRARRVQQQLWADLDQRYVSGVRVLRELARTGAASGASAAHALMPVVFTSTLTHTPPAEIGSTLIGPDDPGLVYSISQTPQVWLDHQALEQAGALVCNWDAIAELFPPGMLDDMFSAYRRLLQRLANDPRAWDEPLPPLLPDAQLAQRHALNSNHAPVGDALLHSLFAAQVEQRPDQPAVVAGEHTLSYAALQRLASQLAHRLRAADVQPNTLIAVVMDKGWEQVVAVLGILQAGAAYLPLDPDQPRERLHYMLEHGQVALALTQTWRERTLDWPAGLRRLCLDDPELARGDDWPLEPIQRADDLAYMIYTSGSTGQPKGVMIDHRGAVNTILDLNERFVVGPADRVLALSALSFDLSVYDIFGTLAAGGTIVMPDAADRRDPARWLELLSRERVTIWNSVPALLEMLIEYATSQRKTLPAALRLVLLSGDWIPVTLPTRTWAISPDTEIISLGGATEASIWSIFYPIHSVDPGWTSIPYGRPLRNQSFHVLSQSLEPCPVWVPGQLYIGGIGLAKGYWRDSGKTEARFITHPRTGERLYHTGDLGRYLPDGNIEFLGREDFQVKIQGYRIELGEIEAALMQHPAVSVAVVTAHAGSTPGSKRLVAYLVPQPDPPGTSPATAADPPVASPSPDDPIARLAFKLDQPGLRRLPDQPRVQLNVPQPTPDELALFIARRSYRSFRPEPIPLADLSMLLSYLRQIELPDYPLPKHRYASAGGLYPVQTYLYIKPDQVAGLAAGSYYYDPEAHQLVLLSADARINRSSHAPPNQPIFEGAAFAIILVGQLRAIEPLYGARSRDFCLIEAGLISQLLDQAAPAHEIGLCHIGDMAFEPLRPLFQLTDDQHYLYSLLGGRIAPAQTSLEALRDETAALRALVPLAREQQLAAPAAAEPRPAQPVAPPDLIGQLRSFLRDKLPDYMVPADFVLLAALPLTANGKLDRQALPAPTGGPSAAPPGADVFQAARTPLEQRLARIWSEVLGGAEPSVHTNFFALGGDSLSGIRIIGRAREAGLHLTPRQLFQHQTIAELAAALEAEAVAPAEAEQGIVSGPLPVFNTWFFEQHFPEQHRWNTSVLLELRRPLDPALAAQTVRELMLHHDALRLRFAEQADGWHAAIVAPEPHVPLSLIDLSALPATQQPAAVEAAAAELQRSLDLTHGPLLRVALFDLGPQPSRLLIIIHHLAADVFSLRIFLEDFYTVYQQLAANPARPEPLLPPKTTSLKQWAERLVGYAESPALEDEFDRYWRALPWEQAVRLPVDYPAGRAANTDESARIVQAVLSAEETHSLLHGLPPSVQLGDVLLTALVRALTPGTGGQTLLVEIVRHGRETIFADIDLSRTMGWLAVSNHALLDLSGSADPAAALRAVQTQLRAIPNQGFGYTVLRYLTQNPRIAAPIRALPQPEVLLNYHGQLDQVFSEDAPFRLAAESPGPIYHPHCLRSRLLEVSGKVFGDRLHLDWIYSENIHQPATVERWAELLLAELRQQLGLLAAGSDAAR